MYLIILLIYYFVMLSVSTHEDIVNHGNTNIIIHYLLSLQITKQNWIGTDGIAEHCKLNLPAQPTKATKFTDC